MIVLDGMTYNCDVSFSREVVLNELYRVQTKNGLQHRKLSAQKIRATIEFSDKDKTEYDALFTALSANVPYHTLTTVWGKSSTKSIECMITSVSDTWSYKDSQGNAFEGLTITFEER